MTKFVKLTAVGFGGCPDQPVWIRADEISLLALPEAISENEGGAVVGLSANSKPSIVRETPEQILALLAEPAPSVEVTEEVVEAVALELGRQAFAIEGDEFPEDDPWAGMSAIQRRQLMAMSRAAIEAADRARGLRP